MAQKEENKGKSKGKYSTESYKKNRSKTTAKPKSAGVSKRKRGGGGAELPKFSDKIRLNKFISNAGICSRREADVLIQAGVVSVNGKIITELGYKVSPTDKISYDGETVTPEKKQYVLLNKPVKFNIKYTDNPAKAKTSAYQLIKTSGPEFLYPVGKLNIDECGLILYTNDLDIEKKLMHPKFKVSQLLHLTLNKDITAEHLEKMEKGMFVDEKMFSVKQAKFVKNGPKNEIGVQIFTPSYGIMKAMLKELGYEIVKLDRVEFAGLTKLDLPRGKYRKLTKKEIAFLKMS